MGYIQNNDRKLYKWVFKTDFGQVADTNIVVYVKMIGKTIWGAREECSSVYI